MAATVEEDGEERSELKQPEPNQSPADEPELVFKTEEAEDTAPNARADLSDDADELSDDVKHGSTSPSSKSVVKKAPKALHPSAVAVFKDWFFSNTQCPYPDQKTKKLLCDQTGASLRQCDTWFINARRRHATTDKIVRGFQEWAARHLQGLSTETVLSDSAPAMPVRKKRHIEGGFPPDHPLASTQAWMEQWMAEMAAARLEPPHMQVYPYTEMSHARQHRSFEPSGHTAAQRNPFAPERDAAPHLARASRRDASAVAAAEAEGKLWTDGLPSYTELHKWLSRSTSPQPQPLRRLMPGSEGDSTYSSESDYGLSSHAGHNSVYSGQGSGWQTPQHAYAPAQQGDRSPPSLSLLLGPAGGQNASILKRPLSPPIFPSRRFPSDPSGNSTTGRFPSDPGPTRPSSLAATGRRPASMDSRTAGPGAAGDELRASARNAIVAKQRWLDSLSDSADDTCLGTATGARESGWRDAQPRGAGDDEVGLMAPPPQHIMHGLVPQFAPPPSAPSTDRSESGSQWKYLVKHMLHNATRIPT